MLTNSDGPCRGHLEYLTILRCFPEEELIFSGESMPGMHKPNTLSQKVSKARATGTAITSRRQSMVRVSSRSMAGVRLVLKDSRLNSAL